MYDGYADFPKTSKMSKQLDKKFDIKFFDDIRDKAYETMCDYTHTGTNQVANNFNEAKGTIEANFSDVLILDMLVGIHALLNILSLDFFEELEVTYEKK